MTVDDFYTPVDTRTPKGEPEPSTHPDGASPAVMAPVPMVREGGRSAVTGRDFAPQSMDSDPQPGLAQDRSGSRAEPEPPPAREQERETMSPGPDSGRQPPLPPELR